ncbi:hypothetical protein [Streptomyces platensis]|uniref:hypothetical protein n=1 Tax=Streptomyces platensis TaxID=58346 RepID=UPI0036B9E9DC
MDFTARAITSLGDDAREGHRTYNMVNPHEDGISLDTFVDWLMTAGHPLTRAERTVDREGVARDVGSQRVVGAVALGGRSAVLEHGQLHRRHEQRFDPADRPEGASGLVGSHVEVWRIRWMTPVTDY